MMDTVERVLRELSPQVGESEARFHGRVARALADAGVSFKMEVPVRRRLGRVDFLVEGGTAIEAKVGSGSRGSLLTQVDGYLGDDRVTGLIVVTERRLPPDLERGVLAAAAEHEKPLRVVALATGVAA